MGQDELVLRVPPGNEVGQYASGHQPPQETTASSTSTTKRSHSRESSGASNFSVKFTASSNDGSQSPKASVKAIPADVSLKGITSSTSLQLHSPSHHRQKAFRNRSDSKSELEQMDQNEENFFNSQQEQIQNTGVFNTQGRSHNLTGNLLSNLTPSSYVITIPSQQQPPTHQSHKTHHRNDSEIQMISDASQRRPLLENHDSSSDDEVSGSTFPFSRQHQWVGNVPADIPPDCVENKIASGSDSDDDDDDDDDDRIPAEFHKTAIAFFIMLFGWVVTTTSLAFTHERVPDIQPLPDIVLDNFNYQSWGLDVSEICIMIIVWTAFLLVMFHKHRCIVLRRIFLLLGLHYTYRAITMYLTVLPKPNMEYSCEPKLNYTTAFEVTTRVLKVLSGMGLSINGKHVYCGDYIYSGHTMTLVTAYLVIRDYSPRNWFILHWIALFTSISGVVMLLAARGHYSIDVLIAYVITTRLWWIYHTLSDNESMKGEIVNKQNYLSRVWWWHIFRYFEKNVPVNLPLKFGWPIPRKLLRFRVKNLQSKGSGPSASGIATLP